MARRPRLLAPATMYHVQKKDLVRAREQKVGVLQSHIVVIQDATRQLLRFRSFAFRVSLVIPVVEVLLARVIQV